MANQDIKPVSSSTGTYAALKLPEQSTAGGKVAPEAGKSMPQLNAATQSIGRDLRFQVDMNTGKSVIQVLDRDTGEIIRQIPPENAKTYVSDSGAVALRLFDDRV